MSGAFALTDGSKARLAEQKVSSALIDSVVTVVLEATAHGLTLTPVGQEPIELAPTVEGDFYSPSLLRLRYQLPPTGPLQQFSLVKGALTLDYQRSR
jgi:hypothetical protein